MRPHFLRPSLLMLLLSALPCFAKVDPTTPIPYADPCVYISHEDMKARMAAQHNGAVIGMTGNAPDTSGRKLEAYFDPVTNVWYLTIVKRSQTTSGSWTVKAASPTCLYGEGDPLPFPAP